jgi:DNA-binding transcriptional MerR regulator
MYSALQASRLAHCSRAQLAHWRRNGLVVPTGEAPTPYTFRDLVALRLVTDWLRSGLTSAQVRRAVEYLRSCTDDLTDLRLVSDGTTVWACFEDGQVLDALRAGQLAFFVDIDGIVGDLLSDVRTFEADRRVFLAQLTESVDLVEAEAAEAAAGGAGVAAFRARAHSA